MNTYCDNFTFLEGSEVQKAFQNLIDANIKPQKYMYMYTKDGFDYFKHIDTRNYIKSNDLGVLPVL